MENIQQNCLFCRCSYAPDDKSIFCKKCNDLRDAMFEAAAGMTAQKSMAPQPGVRQGLEYVLSSLKLLMKDMILHEQRTPGFFAKNIITRHDQRVCQTVKLGISA